MPTDATEKIRRLNFLGMVSRRTTAFWMLSTLTLGMTAATAAETAPDLIPQGAWENPPLAFRPVARWWWPGGSVEADAVREQLSEIEAAGFGAVELQPLLLGMGETDLLADPLLRSVGLESFRKSVALAANEASKRGLGFDLTLGSGWPGGLPTEKLNAERQLLMASRDVEGPTRFVGPLPEVPDQSYRSAVEWALDVLGPRDHDVERVALLAARLGPERDGVPTLAEVRELTTTGEGDQSAWRLPKGDWRIFAFYENSTEHFVMGGAYPGAEADARVVDHLSNRGADALLQGYAAPVLATLAPGQLREIFVDSFELMGELPFTGDFLDSFETMTGYSLVPHLPLVFRVGGESKYAEMMDFFGTSGGARYRAAEPERAQRIREDYEWVRERLFEERFIERLRGFAHQHGAALRLQAHGGYGDYLDVYALADVPEAEGLFGGGSYDFLKLAASAAHVAGRKWASSESFITMRLFGRRLSEDEMRLLAGRAYSAGINRLAYHGVSYPYTRADGDPWFPFPGGFGRILAGPFPMSSDIDSEFLAELPAFNRFVSRLSLAMSQGEASADLAWLRSEGVYPDSPSFQIGSVDAHEGESAETQALRARGLVHDRVSRRMLASARVEEDEIRIGQARYRALLLDPIDVAEPELVETLAGIAEAGFPVLALGALPERAPGLRNARTRDARVRAARKQLDRHVIHVRGKAELKTLLARHVRGSLIEPEAGSELNVSLARRRSPAGEILLVVNESWSPTKARLRFSTGGAELVRWDPWNGERKTLRKRVRAGEVVEVSLGVAESLVLTLARQPDRAPGPAHDP